MWCVNGINDVTAICGYWCRDWGWDGSSTSEPGWECYLIRCWRRWKDGERRYRESLSINRPTIGLRVVEDKMLKAQFYQVVIKTTRIFYEVGRTLLDTPWCFGPCSSLSYYLLKTCKLGYPAYAASVSVERISGHWSDHDLVLVHHWLVH